METNDMEEMILRLRTALWPIAIYRFDSPAHRKGNGSQENLNLCIVVADDKESHHHKALKAYSILGGVASPADIVVRHERDFKKRSQWDDSLERRVRASGELLYGRIEDGPFLSPFALHFELAAGLFKHA